ncbi:MAG: YjfI family protein [Gammaproteobacteria bacterium]|nr:YjfI family protein [Gammaproteobacteria bacterium]
MTLPDLATALNGLETEEGMSFNAEVINGEVPTLQVTVSDREEFPIYITIDDSQILAVSYLWKESEIKPGSREELLEALLTLNIPMPLSSFSKLGGQYVIFGALSCHSDIEDIIHEVDTLSDNTLEALESISEFLQ